MPGEGNDTARVVDEWLAQLTLDERIGLLSGDGPALRGNLQMAKRYNAEPLVAGAVPRLGIEGIRFTDGPRGVVMGRSTCFPVPMARGAAFDPDLEERIGDAIGVEARAQGANLFAGVCVNLLRNPRWGRAQETYGEDPHLLGEAGAALVRGTQRHLMACVKHFACNSMENSRFWVDVRIAEADLRDLYLPHFRRCVDEGVAAVMSAYNKVNGDWCGAHPRLLGAVLKEAWGFEGFVMSDFTLGVRGDGARAVEAGLDLEMPFRWRFRRLRRRLDQGRVSRARIDDAARRLLGQQARFADVGEPDRYTPDAVAGPGHRALAREAAVAGTVLLRNERATLPLDDLTPDGPGVAVLGTLADRVVLGDLGSSRVRPPAAVTVADGLRAAGDARGVTVAVDASGDPAASATLAARAAAAVVVVGSTHHDEGEWIGRAGGDRKQLGLRNQDVDLVLAVAAANPRTAVVLLGGSAFVTEAWRHRVGALVMAWYPGMEGGHALADVLFGDEPPGGRLPCTWPRSERQLPPFRRFARRATYGPLHGYRLFEATGRDPAFWFGHGLGYSPVELGPPHLAGVVSEHGTRTASVQVDARNAGDRAAVVVLQAYVPESLGTEPRPLRTLRAFAKVRLGPGEHRTVALAVPVAGPTSRIWVGTSADPADLSPVDL